MFRLTMAFSTMDTTQTLKPSPLSYIVCSRSSYQAGALQNCVQELVKHGNRLVTSNNVKTTKSQEFFSRSQLQRE